MPDPRNLKPGELLRTLNSTALGECLTDRRLREHRARAGSRFELAGGKRLDLLRYAAWLVLERHTRAPSPASAGTLKRYAAELGVSERTLNTWVERGCPRGDAHAIRAWRANHILPRKGGPRTEATPADRAARALQQRINEANAQKAEQDARSKKLKTDLLAGELLHKGDQVRELAEKFAGMRAVIDAAPDQWAKERPAAERPAAFEWARQVCDRLLRQLAECGNEMAPDHGS